MAISSSSSDSSSDEDNPPVKSPVLLKEEPSSSDSELEQPAKPISILKTPKATAPVKNVNSNLSTVQNLLKTANAATKTQFMKKMIAGSNDKMNEILKSRNSKQTKTVQKTTTSPAPPAKKLERIGFDNDFSSSGSEEDSDGDKSNKTTTKKVDSVSTVKPQIKKSNSDVSDSDSDSDGEEIRKKMEEVKKQLQQNKIKKIIPKTSQPDNSSSSDDSDSEPENNPSKTIINNLKTTALHSKKKSDGESSTDDDKMKSLLTQKDSAPNTPKSKHSYSSDSENDIDTTVSEESGENALIKRFIQQNPDCKPADLKGSFDFSKLTEDEEVFTMKIPISVSPKLLADATFSMIGKTTLTFQNEKYVMMGRHNIERPLLLVTHENNMSQLTTVQIKGSFNLNKKTVVKSHEIIPAKLPTTVEFPADLKERHPLFGVDYSKRIKLDDSVQEKFDGMVTAMCEKIRKTKTKKKPKDQNNSSVNEEVKDDLFNIFEFLKTSFSVKEEAVEENDKSTAKKSKKKKKEKSVTEPEKEIKSPPDFKSPPMKAVADLQKKSGKAAFHSTLMSPSIGKDFNPDESGILSTSTQMSPNSKKIVGSANGKKEKKKKKKASDEELESSDSKKRKLENDDNSMDDFQSTKSVVKADSLADESQNVSKSKKRKKSAKSDK